MAVYPRFRPACLRLEAADSFEVSQPIESDLSLSRYDLIHGHRYPSLRDCFFYVQLQRLELPVCRRHVVFPNVRFVRFDRSDECWAVPLGIAKVEYVPLEHGDQVELSDIFFTGRDLTAVVENVECEEPGINFGGIVWYRADLRVVRVSSDGLREFRESLDKLKVVT